MSSKKKIVVLGSPIPNPNSKGGFTGAMEEAVKNIERQHSKMESIVNNVHRAINNTPPPLSREQRRRDKEIREIAEKKSAELVQLFFDYCITEKDMDARKEMLLALQGKWERFIKNQNKIRWSEALDKYFLESVKKTQAIMQGGKK